MYSLACACAGATRFVSQLTVELHAPARLYGDIETPQLVIHSGVIFEGHCKMENIGKERPEILKGGADAKGNSSPPVKP